MQTVAGWAEVADVLQRLYEASDRLEQVFPGRRFTLDGHLVGSVGEILAAYMFDLALNAASTQGFDAIEPDGREVEIKLTQGRSVGFRHQPQHAIVLHRPRRGPVRTVYNGPGDLVWRMAGRLQSNGQRPITIKTLELLDLEVTESRRLRPKRDPPV